MRTFITQDDVNRTLEKLRTDKKRQSYLRAPADYKEFLPRELGYERRDMSPMFQHLGQIDRTGKQAEELLQVQLYNEQAMEAMRKAQKRASQMKKTYNRLANTTINLPYTNPTVNGTINLGGRGSIRGSGKPGNYGPLNLNAPIKSYQWNGRTLTLNSSVAPRFIGFLNALTKTGYKIYSLGTYANRNIAGTNTKSLHAYGLAMDINPANNPVTYGAPVTNLPRGVGALAARYGLAWGGNWNGSKKDTMHFSVPAYGTK